MENEMEENDAAGVAPSQAPISEEPDCADIIAGSLGVSRAYAYKLMAEAVAASGVMGTDGEKR